MARFQFDDWFGWPCADIVQFFIDGVDLVPHEALDDVKMRKELENRRQGNKVYTKGEWCVHGQIPRIAQKLLRPDMLTFIEETVWDDDDASFHTKVTPHFLRHALHCETMSRYEPVNGALTRRYFRGVVRVKIPIIGPVLEKAIVDGLMKSNVQNYEIMTRELSERLGPETKHGKTNTTKFEKSRNT